MSDNVDFTAHVQRWHLAQLITCKTCLHGFKILKFSNENYICYVQVCDNIQITGFLKYNKEN